MIGGCDFFFDCSLASSFACVSRALSGAASGAIL